MSYITASQEVHISSHYRPVGLAADASYSTMDSGWLMSDAMWSVGQRAAEAAPAGGDDAMCCHQAPATADITDRGVPWPPTIGPIMDSDPHNPTHAQLINQSIIPL